jgi:hypothetical protein
MDLARKERYIRMSNVGSDSCNDTGRLFVCDVTSISMLERTHKNDPHYDAIDKSKLTFPSYDFGFKKGKISSD